jgi:hypothetical protein
MQVHQVIVLARKHFGGDMESSARLCLADAISIVNEFGDLNQAKARALKSLAYSVGVFHPDYIRASK